MEVGKDLKKKRIQPFILKKMYCLYFKNSFKLWKNNNSLEGSKCKKRLALSFSGKISALLKGIDSKHKGNYYYFNCLHSFRTENKLKSHVKKCKCKDFLGIVMPFEEGNISKVNQYI